MRARISGVVLAAWVGSGCTAELQLGRFVIRGTVRPEPPTAASPPAPMPEPDSAVPAAVAQELAHLRHGLEEAKRESASATQRAQRLETVLLAIQEQQRVTQDQQQATQAAMLRALLGDGGDGALPSNQEALRRAADSGRLVVIPIVVQSPPAPSRDDGAHDRIDLLFTTGLTTVVAIACLLAGIHFGSRLSTPATPTRPQAHPSSLIAPDSPSTPATPAAACASCCSQVPSHAAFCPMCGTRVSGSA